MLIPTFGAKLDWYYDVENQLIDRIARRSEELIMEGRRKKNKIASVVEFEEWRKYTKDRFLDAIGGLPKEKSPLNPTITGRREMDGYFIDLVRFESRPRFYITANLYLPKELLPKNPAVLFLCGHAEEAKAYPTYQKVCISLAKRGFVVLAVDPLGQGERLQYMNRETGKADIEWGTTEHTYAGIQYTLRGSNIAREFIWDAIRGVDFLVSLPYVDPDRIGVTGNSGGGTQASYLMMTDDRIAAAMPCTFITSCLDYLYTGQPKDSEQIIAGAYAMGLDEDDYVTAIAPRPVRIGAVESDFFCIEGTEYSFAHGKRIYSLYGAEDKISLLVSPGTHAYTTELRRGCVEFFSYWLKGETMVESWDEGDITPLTPRELQVTRTGQVLLEYEDALSIHKLHEVDVKTEMRVDRSTDLAERIKSHLGLDKYERNKTPLRVRYISEATVNVKGKEYKSEKAFFFSEPKVCISFVTISPKGADSVKPTMLLFENGTTDLNRQSELAVEISSCGKAVFIADARGTGAVSSRLVNNWGGPTGLGIYGSEYRLSCDAVRCGESILGMRVYDLIRTLDHIRQLYSREDIDVVACGKAAYLALLLAGADDRVGHVTVSEIPPSFEEIADTRLYDFDPRLISFGILNVFDLPEIVERLKVEGRLTVGV